MHVFTVKSGRFSQFFSPGSHTFEGGRPIDLIPLSRPTGLQRRGLPPRCPSFPTANIKTKKDTRDHKQERKPSTTRTFTCRRQHIKTIDLQDAKSAKKKKKKRTKRRHPHPSPGCPVNNKALVEAKSHTHTHIHTRRAPSEAARFLGMYVISGSITQDQNATAGGSPLKLAPFFSPCSLPFNREPHAPHTAEPLPQRPVPAHSQSGRRSPQRTNQEACLNSPPHQCSPPSLHTLLKRLRRHSTSRPTDAPSNADPSLASSSNAKPHRPKYGRER